METNCDIEKQDQGDEGDGIFKKPFKKVPIIRVELAEEEATPLLEKFTEGPSTVAVQAVIEEEEAPSLLQKVPGKQNYI